MNEFLKMFEPSCQHSHQIPLWESWFCLAYAFLNVCVHKLGSKPSQRHSSGCDEQGSIIIHNSFNFLNILIFPPHYVRVVLACQNYDIIEFSYQSPNQDHSRNLKGTTLKSFSFKCTYLKFWLDLLS